MLHFPWGSFPYEPTKEISLYWYDKYCQQLDTIIAENWEDYYLVKHKSYTQAYTERELEDMGYRYTGRWIKNLEPPDIIYYFIEQPTLKGFINWLKTQ